MKHRIDLSKLQGEGFVILIGAYFGQQVEIVNQQKNQYVIYMQLNRHGCLDPNLLFTANIAFTIDKDGIFEVIKNPYYPRDTNKHPCYSVSKASTETARDRLETTEVNRWKGER